MFQSTLNIKNYSNLWLFCDKFVDISVNYYTTSKRKLILCGILLWHDITENVNIW